MRWHWLRVIYWFRSKREDFVMGIAWLLPHSIIYWAGMRLVVNSTTGPFGARNPSEVRFFDVLEDWKKRRGGDHSWRKNGRT